MIIPVRIQGIHNPICVGIKEFYNYAVIRGHPDSPVTIVITHRYDFSHIKSQEIIHPGDNRFVKPDPLGTIHAELYTIGVGRGGRKPGRHRLRRGVLACPGGDGGQLVNIISIFIYQICVVVTGKDHGAGAASKFIGYHCALMGSHSIRISVKGESGGYGIFRDHLNCFSYGNIVPGHVDFPLSWDQSLFLVDDCDSTSSFNRNREPAFSVGKSSAVFHVAVDGDVNI